MKSTIGKKFILLVFVPFLLIIGSLLAYISQTVFRYVTNWTELELKGIADINAIDFESRMDNVKYSILSANHVLEKIDPRMEDARKQADAVVRSMLENEYVYNAWFVYEPQAFDGRDREFVSDYPGAPSGRFMRSYIKEDGQIMVAPDMDEQSIDDREESPWYVVPRDTNQVYYDVDNQNPNLYDYKVGKESKYTLSIVAPIHRDGLVIGCIGADLMFDDVTFGLGDENQATVVVFYPNGRVFYSPSFDFAEKSMESLAFTNLGRIKDAMSKNVPLFLPNEYSVFVNAKAFTYFRPIYIKDSGEGNLYLYAALSRDSVYRNVKPIVVAVICVSIAVLLVLMGILSYVVKTISKPIKELTLAADAISQGDLEIELNRFSKSKDEIGLMSRSLHRMVEQFRIYIMRQEQAQAEMSVYSQIGRFLDDSNDLHQTFGELVEMLCRYFDISKVTLVHMVKGRALVKACFDVERDLGGTDGKNPPEFLHHVKVESLFAGKKIVFLNQNAIATQKLTFLEEGTVSVCILPLWGDGLCGYVILENRDARRLFKPSMESLLVGVAGILADGLTKEDLDSYENGDEKTLGPEAQGDDEPEGELVRNAPAKDGEKDMLGRLQGVEGLDVEEALNRLGGLRDVLVQSIALAVRLIPEVVGRMDGYLNEDATAFAIEIHGLKGTLNNIGMYALGDGALKLEKAAKAGDMDYCHERYEGFKDSLMRFLQQLQEATADTTVREKESGDANALEEALEKVKGMLEDYDSIEALETMSPFTDFSFGKERDALLGDMVRALEEFDCEKAMEIIERIRREGNVNEGK